MLFCRLQAKNASVNKQIENMSAFVFMGCRVLSGKNNKTIALIDKKGKFTGNKQKTGGHEAARTT